ARKLVFAHPNSGADVLRALRAGVDVIAHTTPATGPWEEAIRMATRECSAALTPTLQIFRQWKRHDRSSAQEESANAAARQLNDWIDAGGTVLFGTDLGAADYDPTEEFVAMADAGMTFAQILASLTTAPAARFGDSNELGRIAPGFHADLVAMRGDPARDIRALAAVQLTVRAGKILFQAAR
ncbi:MAG TPA: amidohydrolase family protein, partial [Myxococcales bacterium]|nr:amidohydrolase family protein [Myxococcales bacterium]